MAYIDAGDPRVQRTMVKNIKKVYNDAPEHTRTAGKQWYQNAHDLSSHAARSAGLSPSQGAAITALASPGMDWNAHNKNVVSEAATLGDDVYRAVERSAKSGEKRRTPEAAEALRGTSLSRATDSQILKVRSVVQGESPEKVLNPLTGPKTHRFFHNINDPDNPHPVTIDGRGHDLAINRMIGWQTNRGISSANLPSGSTSRYEHFESAYRTAAHHLSKEHGETVLPLHVQAVTWQHGKDIEMATPTKSGSQRVRGPIRSGQRYF